MEQYQYGDKSVTLIVDMTFGSHLYGTDTPASDHDYKAIYLPTKREILLGKIPQTLKCSTKRGEGKNATYDVDRDIYSLHYFIQLAKSGETGVLDMLHAPPKMIISGSQIWDSIVANRDKFYTKSLKALVGYARRQAAKYGLKGGKLNSIQTVANFINSLPPTDKLKSHWDKLPMGDHIHKLPADDNRFRFYQVAGRKFMDTVKISTIADSVNHMLTQYGGRAKDAAENKNIDWKALSHAIRAAMEVQEILTANTITFPLAEADYIRSVKLGELDYTTEVAPRLEVLMSEIELLAAESDLPQVVDHAFWDDWLVGVLDRHCFEKCETCYKTMGHWDVSKYYEEDE